MKKTANTATNAISEYDIENQLLAQIKRQIKALRCTGIAVVVIALLNIAMTLLNELTDVSKLTVVALSGVLLTINLALLIVVVVTGVKIVDLAKTLTCVQKYNSSYDEAHGGKA